MEKTVLISMPLEDLQSLIIDCVRTGLKYSTILPEKQKATQNHKVKSRKIKKQVEVSNG